jgi:two-component system chemotaxis response regulator CheB
VLVVDDSAYVRKVVSQLLSKSPFLEVVGTARDGQEALERVVELEPDVVTCDLIMPNLDGVGFVREQKEQKKKDEESKKSASRAPSGLSISK